MKRKPSIKELKRRSAIWIDQEGDLRITLSDREQRTINTCHCRSCLNSNSWYYSKQYDEWFTSIFGIEGMRHHYEFLGFI